MGKGKLLDARPHDEVGILRNLALVGLAVAMQGDLGHRSGLQQLPFAVLHLGSTLSISLIGISLAT